MHTGVVLLETQRYREVGRTTEDHRILFTSRTYLEARETKCDLREQKEEENIELQGATSGLEGASKSAGSHSMMVGPESNASSAPRPISLLAIFQGYKANIGVCFLQPACFWPAPPQIVRLTWSLGCHGNPSASGI